MLERKPSEGERKRRRRYEDGFKRRAVELSERGDRLIGEVARELGLTEDTLYRWRREYGVAARNGIGTPEAAEPRSVTELERENRELRAKLADLEAREIILKKSLGILSEAPGSGMPKWKR